MTQGIFMSAVVWRLYSFSTTITASKLVSVETTSKYAFSRTFSTTSHAACNITARPTQTIRRMLLPLDFFTKPLLSKYISE